MRISVRARFSPDKEWSRDKRKKEEERVQRICAQHVVILWHIVPRKGHARMCRWTCDADVPTYLCFLFVPSSHALYEASRCIMCGLAKALSRRPIGLPIHSQHDRPIKMQSIFLERVLSVFATSLWRELWEDILRSCKRTGTARCYWAWGFYYELWTRLWMNKVVEDR